MDEMKTIVTIRCPICGNFAEFKIKSDYTLLRDASCQFCGVSLRTSDLIEVLLNTVDKKHMYITLQDWRANHFGKKILNMASFGKIHEVCIKYPNYFYGEFFDGIESGKMLNGIQCINLQDIPFRDNTFDFIITEDVFEHVENIDKGFSEIYRVLKPNGYHIFTVPIHESNKTMKRNFDQPVYHIDPLRKKGALVVTDFGDDLDILLKKYGMTTKKIISHRFFNKNEVSDLSKKDQYNYYLNNRNDLMKVFKYNSIVFLSQKLNSNENSSGIKRYLTKWFSKG